MGERENDTSPLIAERPAPGVLALWLHRPARRNALDEELTGALLDAFARPDARAIVLGSAAPAVFCAGADLGLGDAARAAVSDQLYELYERMLRCPAPVICALPGPAVGGGAQLAIASDLRVGDGAASFRFPGPGHGLAVGAWGLPSIAGRGRALDLCLTMRTVDAREALAIGLLDRLLDDPRTEALRLAGEIAALEPSAVARVKGVARTASGVLAALDAERTGNANWDGSVAGLTRERR